MDQMNSSAFRALVRPVGTNKNGVVEFTTIAAFVSPRLVFQYSWPKLREVRIYTVAQETLVGLSHRKGDPWRVNPFRATARARATF